MVAPIPPDLGVITHSGYFSTLPD
jgi:hypothetical protein